MQGTRIRSLVMKLDPTCCNQDPEQPNKLKKKKKHLSEAAEKPSREVPVQLHAFPMVHIFVTSLLSNKAGLEVTLVPLITRQICLPPAVD